MEDFLEKISPLKYKAAFHAAAGEIQEAFEREYRNLRKGVSAPGFRRGKTPISYVRKNYFKEVQGRVLKALIEEGYAQTIRKNKLDPAGSAPADAQLPHENQDFKFKLIIEVHPEVQAKVFENFHLKIKKQEDIGPGQVSSVLENLRKEDKNNKNAAAFKGENLQRLKKEILERLKLGAAAKRKEELRELAFNQLLEKNSFELPESIVLKHKQHLADRTRQKLFAQGLNPSQVEQWLKKNDRKIYEQSKKNAAGFYLIKNLALKLNLNETKAETLQTLHQHWGRKEISENDLSALRWQSIYTKVLDYIVSQSKIDETA